MALIAAAQLQARSRREADVALEEALAAVDDAASRGADLVVLPECTWPGYILGSDHGSAWSRLPEPAAVVSRFAERARAGRLHVVVGLALPTVRPGADARLVNAGVVIGPDGQVLHTAEKRFLWDVDRHWFRAGSSSHVTPTAIGRLGVMICADGRMPEIARELAVSGAELLIDPTAWVTAGPDPSTWDNAQSIHMLPTRARENGVWVVAANKVGVERDLVAYCGRSCIIAPDGTVVARAPSDVPALVLAEVHMVPAAPPVGRRPDLYADLVVPTATLHVRGIVGEPLVPSAASRRIAVSALDRPLDDDDARTLGDAGIGLVVSAMGAARVPDGAVVVRKDGADAAVLVAGASSGAEARWVRTHGHGAPGSAIGPVVATPAGYVGVMLGEDGLAMEPARVLMLRGADIIVWFAGDVEVGTIAATRAAENRVVLVVVDGDGRARVLDVNGNPLADSGRLRRMVSAVIALDDPRRKEMAPGTDVVEGRQPACYGALVDASGSEPR